MRVVDANGLAVLWALLASGFLGFAANGYIIARSDRIESESNGDPEVVFINEGRERRQFVRVIGFVLFLIVGVVAILPLPASGFVSLIAIGGLFIGMAALGAEDVIDQVDRSRFRRFQRDRVDRR